MIPPEHIKKVVGTRFWRGIISVRPASTDKRILQLKMCMSLKKRIICLFETIISIFNYFRKITTLNAVINLCIAELRIYITIVTTQETTIFGDQDIVLRWTSNKTSTISIIRRRFWFDINWYQRFNVNG